MKILCVIDCLGSGGSQRQIVELALGFKEKGHTVSFLTYHNIVFYDPILLKEGISITCIQKKNYLGRIVKMRQFIRKGKFDGVVAFLEGPGFISEVAGFPYRKWRLVISEGSANPNIYKSARHIMYRMFHVFTDYVVANSYSNMRIVRKVNPFLRGSACKVVYNIIDFDRWKPLPTYVPRKNGKLGIIVLASHQYLKNLNGLVEAISLLTPEEQNMIEISWYGDRLTEPYFDNSYIEGKKKLADLKIGHVVNFYPATNPIIQKVQEADVLGLLSFYEGFPNVVCEGMACAKPILCTAVSDLPRIFAKDKNLLCDPSKPVTIRNAIRYLINLSNDELSEIGWENRYLAQKLFQKQKNVEGYLQLLK